MLSPGPSPARPRIAAVRPMREPWRSLARLRVLGSWFHLILLSAAALDKGVRLKGVGQPVAAKLLEPVYAGEDLALPAGSTIKGHVSSIATTPMRKRAGRLLAGDFTPPKT